jgi:hypothetical protein
MTPAATLPMAWPSTSDRTNWVASTSAVASKAAPTSICRLARALKLASTQRPHQPCCTAGAVKSTRLATDSINVARKTFFSAWTMLWNPGSERHGDQERGQQLRGGQQHPQLSQHVRQVAVVVNGLHGQRRWLFMVVGRHGSLRTPCGFVAA